MPDRWDVAVLGAGPAGSCTASLLARRGYRVVLLDRRHFPRDKPCAEYLSPGVVAALRGVGMDGSFFAAEPLAVPGMEIVSPRGRRFSVQYGADGRPMSAYTLPRLKLDALLLEAARDAGVELVEGFTGKRAMVRDGRVAGIEGSLEGAPLTVASRMTIAADGARSLLARSVGLARPVHWPARLGLIAHFRRVTLPGGYGQMHVARDGYCGVAPLPDDRVNVGLVVRSGRLAEVDGNATDFMDRWIDSQPALRELFACAQRNGRVHGLQPIGARVARPYAPGLLFVGDAAGFFDPFTGEGIYRAIAAAPLCAGAAAAIADNPRDEATVTREYARARSQVFGRKSAVTMLVQIFVWRPELLEYALARLGARPHAGRRLSAVLGDIAPASEFLNAGTLWETLRP